MPAFTIVVMKKNRFIQSIRPLVRIFFAGIYVSVLAIVAHTAAFAAQLQTPAPLPKMVQEHIPDGALVGSGQLRVLFWRIYDAELYAPNGQWQFDGPFALVVNYLRDISNETIVTALMKEIRSQGFSDENTLQLWERWLHDVMPSVQIGDRFIAVSTTDSETALFHQGEYLGTLADSRFTRYFFNIIFGPDSSYPQLKDQLLKN